MSDETIAEPTETQPTEPTAEPEAKPADADAAVTPEPAAAEPAPTEPVSTEQPAGVETIGQPEPTPEPAAEPTTEPAPSEPEATPTEQPGLAPTAEAAEDTVVDEPPVEPKADEPAPEPTAEPTAELAAEPAPSDSEPGDAPADAEEPAKPADEGISITVPSETATMFDGKSGPHPDPDLGGEEALPHPALTGNQPGYISGTTAETQAFLPVPGEVSQAAAAAQLIDDAGKPPASPQDEPKGDAPTEATEATESTDAPTAEAAPAAEAPADDAPAAPSTPAVPTAAHAPCAFQDLNDDAAAGLDGFDDSEAEVLRLELQGLANVALALVKRLEKLGQKAAVPEHLEQMQASAQSVVSQALNIFETSEDDLNGFESASAELVLDDLGDEI